MFPYGLQSYTGTAHFGRSDLPQIRHLHLGATGQRRTQVELRDLVRGRPILPMGRKRFADGGSVGEGSKRRKGQVVPLGLQFPVILR